MIRPRAARAKSLRLTDRQVSGTVILVLHIIIIYGWTVHVQKHGQLRYTVVLLTRLSYLYNRMNF